MRKSSNNSIINPKTIALSLALVLLSPWNICAKVKDSVSEIIDKTWVTEKINK